MGKLYFHYSTMNAGKSTGLLQAAHNYMERGMIVFFLTAKLDTRAGPGVISSRIGLSHEAETFSAGDDVYIQLRDALQKEPTTKCIFVDEAQFLSKDQVWQLARFVDDFNIPVMSYGLRVDAFGELFPGSAALLAIADEMREVRTICHCGKKAGMVVRRGADGKAQKPGEGAQVQIGGNDVYVSLCRRHWREEVGDMPPSPPKTPCLTCEEPERVASPVGDDLLAGRPGVDISAGGESPNARVPVQRSMYRPSDVPTELLDMIHSVAASAAAKSSVPFEPSAVAALEEAMEPMLEALCASALKHAQDNGREDITEADLKAVSSSYMKQ